jgi:hypothetical protein
MESHEEATTKVMIACCCLSFLPDLLWVGLLLMIKFGKSKKNQIIRFAIPHCPILTVFRTGIEHELHLKI